MNYDQKPGVRSLNDGEMDSVNGGALLFMVCFIVGVIAGAAKAEADDKARR